MGSKGYLINHFLVARTNQRNDEYEGGRFANQMRLDMKIVRDTWEVCGPDYTIIFHLSLLDLVEGGSAWEEVKTLALVQALEDADLTILNTDIGFHEARIREWRNVCRTRRRGVVVSRALPPPLAVAVSLVRRPVTRQPRL